MRYLPGFCPGGISRLAHLFGLRARSLSIACDAGVGAVDEGEGLLGHSKAHRPDNDREKNPTQLHEFPVHVQEENACRVQAANTCGT